MKKFFLLIVLFGYSFTLNAQIDLKDKLKGYVNPEELVSLSESLPFNQAIEILSKVSEKLTGKKIVTTALITSPIGFEIDKMPYKKALFIIVQSANLIIEETETTTVIKRKDDSKTNLAKDVYASVDEREVKISAVIFEANVSEMREQGINWQFLLSRSGLSLGGNLNTVQETSTTTQGQTATATQSQQNPPDFTLTPKIEFTLGDKYDGTAEGLFRFFETENLGKIITRPTISVVNGQAGKTKVGADFSIKERDFAGNLIDKFYQSGTIIEVTPHIYTEEGIDYILLNVKIEKSSVVIGSLSVEKPITEVTTKVLLRNGEETAIGGLLVNEEATVRRGVPFLKDLPWWVLGLRYIFGYDQVTVSQKEIITLLKIELLPTLKERIDLMKKEALKQERKEQLDALEKYKQQLKSMEPKKED
jgi:type II secretory pathway component GspD/PulD (secretin)